MATADLKKLRRKNERYIKIRNNIKMATYDNLNRLMKCYKEKAKGFGSIKIKFKTNNSNSTYID